jgi:hypothetical protein
MPLDGCGLPPPKMDGGYRATRPVRPCAQSFGALSSHSGTGRTELLPAEVKGLEVYQGDLEKGQSLLAAEPVVRIPLPPARSRLRTSLSGRIPSENRRSVSSPLEAILRQRTLRWDLDEMLPNTTVSTDATLFREEAERARRYAAAMTDKKIIDRLNEIAALYDELAAGQDFGPTDRD